MRGGLGGGWEDAVEAEVHGLGGIVVGPGARERQDDTRTGSVLIVKERHGFAEARVIDFGESGRTEVERGLEGSNKFVLGIRISQFGHIGSGDAADLRAKGVVGLRNVQREVGEGVLLGSGLEGEFVRGHGISSRSHVFRVVGETGADRVGDGAGRRRLSGGRGLGDGKSWSENEQCERAEKPIHESLPEVARTAYAVKE